MSLSTVDGGTVWLVTVPVLVGLAALVLLAAARRLDTDTAIGSLSHQTRRRDPERATRAAGRGREVERAAKLAWRDSAAGTVATTTPLAPVPWVPPDRETIGVGRRAFLNRSIVRLFGVGLTGFGLSTLGFLWPSGSGGFGSKIRIGRLGDIRDKIAEGNGFAYYPEGRLWITEYPATALEKARSVYPPAAMTAMETGFAVMYQKCPHLGCRVPSCVSSQWFECPCHGSQYNRAGEKKGGPAPRGLDRFATAIAGDTLTVDTGTILIGPAIGTNTTGQEAEGPHCVSGGE